MAKIALGFGGGHIDIVIDLVSGRVEPYLGGDFGNPDLQGFHARHGGKQFYQSRSGASGAGWMPATPTLRKVNGYRVDVHEPWIDLHRDPIMVAGKSIFVPFSYRDKSIMYDWPVVIRDNKGITFCEVGDIVLFLRGQLDALKREYCIKYVKMYGGEKECRRTVNQKEGARWANAGRLVEHLSLYDVKFEFPEDWRPSGDGDFWQKLGFRRLPNGLFKVVRGIGRAHIPEQDWTVDAMRQYAPSNVYPISEYSYIQESNEGYVGVGRYQFDNEWYDYEAYLEPDHVFRVFGGSQEDIEKLHSELFVGARAKHERVVEDRAYQEQLAAEELARDAVFRELLEKYADVEVRIADSLEAGNCRPGTMEFINRFFPGRETATVKELARFVTTWGVRRVLEHKLLPLAADPIQGADDLTQLESISRALAKKLNEHGIFRFAQLAQLNQAGLDGLDLKLNAKGRISRSGWPEMAKKMLGLESDAS